MTGSDWAAIMVPALKEEFDVTSDRAIRITTIVRWLVSNPEYEHLRDRGLLDDQFNETFIDDLVESLKAQPERTLEERWNALVRDFGLYAELGDEVLLRKVEPSNSFSVAHDDDHSVSAPSRTQISLSEFDGAYEQAVALKEIAQEPHNLDLNDVLVVLETPSASPPAHATATQALLIASNQGLEIDARFVNPLITLLDRPSLDADVLLLSALREIAKNDPSALEDVLERILEEVDVNESDSTRIALKCCTELAIYDPSSVIDLTPKLSELVVSEDRTIRIHASYLLACIARDHPTELKPLSPKLVELIASDDETYQTNVLAALGHLTTYHSIIGPSETRAIATLVESSSSKLRANAVGLLADIAKSRPGIVYQHHSLIKDSLHDSDDTVRGNAVSAILHIGLDRREAIESTLPALIELVDDPEPMVRRNVARTLGTLEAVVAIEQMRTLADSDPDEGVREIASWAVKRMVE